MINKDDFKNDITRSLIINNEQISILCIDIDFKVLEFNEQSKTIINSIKLKIGASFFEFLALFDNSIVIALEKTFNGKYQEVIHQHKITNCFYESMIYPLFNEENEVYGAVIQTKDVSIRENYRLSLERNEKELRDLYEKAPLGYQSLDQKGNFIYVNETLTKMLGYTKEEMIGQWFGDFLYIEGAETFKTNFSKFKAKGKTVVNIKMLSKSGKIITIRFDGRIGYAKDGSFKQTHCILKDITKEEAMMQTIIRSEENYSMVLNSAAEAIYGVDYNDLCTFVNRSFLEMFKFKSEKAVIGKNMHDLVHYKTNEGRTYKNEDCPMMQTLEKGISKHVINEKMFKSDGTSFFSEYYANPQIRDGKIIGAVVTITDNSDKKLLKETLIAEKKLTEITLLSVGDGIITTDINSNITLLNKSAEELTGWSSKDAIGKNIEEVFRIFNDRNGEKCRNIVEQVLQLGTQQELENHTMLHSKNNDKLPIADSASPIKNENGDIIGVVIVFRDYSEKYQKEEQINKLLKDLQKSQTFLEASLESPKDMIVLSIDRDFKYNFFNQNHKTTMLNLYGTKAKIGESILDKIANKDDRIKAKRNYSKALSGETHVVIETYGENQDLTFESYFYPIYNADNTVVGASGFARDITMRMKEQQKLRDSFERLDRSQKLSKVGSWELSLDTNLIWASQEAFNIYELVSDTGYISFDIIEQMISPTQRKVLNNALHDLIYKGKPYDVHFTLDNGVKKKLIHSKASLTTNSLGEPTKVLGVIRDITEMQNKENELIYISYHDALTGLYNRRYYEDTLDKLDIQSNYPLTIVMSDINGLKLINDAFGHAAGDKLLVAAGKIIKDSCRSTDIIARIGGDEFLIVMPNTRGEEADEVIRKINQKTKNIIVESIELSISFGFATKDNSNIDIQDIFRRAEDQMYREKLIEIPSMRSGAIETILNTLYEKDNNSEIHSRNVSDISEKLAVAYGMDRQEVNEVKTAGLLHDIGKIIIPISIITKEGKLTLEEYELIKGHPEIGFRILNSTHDLRSISNIVLNHHERWDGLGYPRGIKAEEIPLQSRIISIADAFDAMTSERTYRETSTNKEALDELVKFAGTQFDPALVKVFIENFSMINNNGNSK